MRKGQQQIRCSSGVSIAGRTDSHLQVISVFIPVLSSHILNPLFLTKSVHVILLSSSHGLLKLCPNPNLGVFSSAYTYGYNKNTCWCPLCLWFQIQGLPPQKTRGSRGQMQGQVPETVRSGGDVVVPLPYGGDTGISLQGQTLTTFLLEWLNLMFRESDWNPWSTFHTCFFAFRKRRSPSPGRRRRTPSPPRRRRSPSPPRRRYKHHHFISRAIICISYLTIWNVFDNWIWCYSGLLPHLPVVVLHPPDDILPLSSVATAPHLCRHRRGGCQTLLPNAPLQGPSDVPLDPQSAEVLPLKGDARLQPPHLHQDTGGAPCCLLSGQAGIHDLPTEQPAASPHHLQTAVAMLGVPLVLRDVLRPPVHRHLTSGDSSPLHTVVNPSAECPALQSHATTRGSQGS